MPGGDPMAEIRAKMAQDPSYDPMKDPAAMQQLEQMIPSEMRDFPQAVERLKVAFTDATTGPDAKTAAELGEILATIAEKRELISSPNSAWVQGGMQQGESTNEEKLNDLYNQVKAANPDVPEEP